MTRPSQLQFKFVESGATAHARLLWDEAPVTCDAVVKLLPIAGRAHHAIYSGSECVQLLKEVPRIGRENATADVKKGQVAFTWMAAGTAYGVNEDFAEVCWFYDIDAQPRMWEGVVEVNIFGEIVGDAQEFYAVCRQMRREGVKALRIEAVN
jgi:hypothetical protein